MLGHVHGSLPAEQRTIPLSVIAERTKLSVDGVEFLLMKTLSLHLIEGIIDQVASTVQVRLNRGPQHLGCRLTAALSPAGTTATCLCLGDMRW